MKKDYKKYIAVVAFTWAGSFLLFMLTYLLVLAPQIAARKSLEKQLIAKKQLYYSTLKAAQEENKILLKEQVDNLERTLRNYTIDFENTANLTFDISQIANDKRVGSFSINTRDYREIPNCARIRENEMFVDFTGSFSQFAAFLNALER